MAKIITRKPYLIEGKLIKKGTIIRFVEDDIDSYDAPDTSSDASMPDSYDIETARRMRKARMLRKVDLADGDEMTDSEDFPADEVQAMRRAKKLRAMRMAKKAEAEVEEDDDIEAMRRAKKACDEVTEEDDIDEEDDVEKMKRLRRIRRLRKMQSMKKADDEVTEEDDIDEEDGIVAKSLKKADDGVLDTSTAIELNK